MATGMDIVNAAREYIGAPYRYWTGVYPEYGPPGYNDWQNAGYYPSGYVTSEGVHCAGLVNLARMECGLQPIGLTKQYSDWIWASGTGSYFDPSSPGVPGAICVIPWDPSTGAEGHVAIYTDAHTLIQATLSSGIWEGEQDYDSYQWQGIRDMASCPTWTTLAPRHS